jgi:hypothetical protein
MTTPNLDLLKLAYEVEQESTSGTLKKDLLKSCMSRTQSYPITSDDIYHQGVLSEVIA